MHPKLLSDFLNLSVYFELIQGLPLQRWTLFSHYTDTVLVSFPHPLSNMV
uniref:Uncharacterized protein n=1 Tax=Siphoviridae sp. ct7xv9 TaxID=2825355 RepID=A0A8S5PMF0_9CAUD|nr:MAG TPA: hypothetical protein [Siphoviridae sp. ct7xv9]